MRSSAHTSSRLYASPCVGMANSTHHTQVPNHHTACCKGRLRTKIGEEDGVVAILTAMRGHEENRAVQERACTALQHLVAEGKYKR